VPRPLSSFAPVEDLASGWFAHVPAYRLASFRTGVALLTLVFHVPKFSAIIRDYTASAFHVPPAFAWLPVPTLSSGAMLIGLQYVAATGLLLGFGARACAWLLAGAGFYVLLLDPEHYSHNAHFHLTLLALIGCSRDGISLRRLIGGGDADARCPAWPERLVRLQVAIVFFYAALDKVFSPFWGLSGRRLAALRMAGHGPGLNWILRLNQAATRTAPAALSVATIAVEFFLAVAALARPLWRVGLAVGLLFIAYLEFLVKPGLFTWDMFAAGLLFLPAGDGGWQVHHDPHCPACRRIQAALLRLDWLRRLRGIPREHETGLPRGTASLELVSPHGRTRRGFDAVRVLPAILVGPVFVVMAMARFGGDFLSARGFGPWDVLPYLLLTGYLALWVPGVDRVLGRPLHAALGAHTDQPRRLDPPFSRG
jgi:vitamin K-dependent gamma-carboxylase-like protein